MKKVQSPLFRLLGSAKHAAISIKKVISAAATGQPVLVSDMVRGERESICQTCENNQNGRCQLCGCSTCGNILNKTKYATERCPANKWPVSLTN